MKIEFVLEQIEKEIGEIHDYKVYIIDDEEKLATDEHSEYSAIGIEIEDDGKEINVLTDQYQDKKQFSDADLLTVSEFYKKLKELIPQCTEYSMYSASSKKYVDEDHWVRLDVPLVAVGRDYELRKFILLQSKQ